MIALIVKMLAYAATQTLSLFQDLLLAVAVLLVLTAAAVKAHARPAPPARISPTAGSRAAVFVLLVLTAAALVRLHARHALLGRSKDRQDSRRAPCVLLVHTARL